MATLYIDGRPYEFEEGQNLLQTCLELGFDLPYFCWHPALGSVGACRQCAVKQFRDENDTRGQLVMACMTPATDGIRIAINDPEAVEFRAGIIELLMINHPHDCPVCDEGGECHLQDMTVMTGHHRRRFRFAKRTHRNQDLGSFIQHEMNRCIQCYRCVRFYRDYAGGRDLDVMSSGNRVYFGRHEPGPLENEFSGNLVEICPTGVFTDKTFKRHYTRKWDLQTAPSVCVHCAVGCNTLPGERNGELRRVRNRYHHQVNGYFLCDRGRFGYEFVNSPQRIRASRYQAEEGGDPIVVNDQEAVLRLGELLSGQVIGIGSPRASVEANFALRTLVGEERFFAGVASHEARCTQRIVEILQHGPVPSATMQGAGLADAVLILGEDVIQTAPILGLNLRRLRFRRAALAAAGFQLPAWNDAAVRELAQLQRPNLFVATAAATGLDDEAMDVYRATPDELVRLGIAIRSALMGDIDQSAGRITDRIIGLDDTGYRFAIQVADALLKAERPLIVTGVSGGRQLIEAAANIAWQLKHNDRKAALSFCLPEANSMGLMLMQPGDLSGAFEAVEQGRADTVIVLENDLYRRAASQQVDAFLNKARRVVVIDHSGNATTDKAQLVLPAATFAETTGTLVNSEGRAQRSYAVMETQSPAAWRWFQKAERAVAKQTVGAWQTLEDLTEALARQLPVFQPLTQMALLADPSLAECGIPRQSHRRTGRTAIHAHIDIHEPKPPEDVDSPLRFSMEGLPEWRSAGLNARYWAPGWNSVQALNKFQHPIAGALRNPDSGRRLLEPVDSGIPDFFEIELDVSRLPEDAYLVVPVYHIFGSDPLSMGAPGIAQRAPQPYVGLCAEDGVAGQGEKIIVEIDDIRMTLPVRHLPGLLRHTVALPVGLSGMPALALPGVCRLLLP